MDSHEIELANRQIRRVTYLGLIGNIVLSALKVFVGTMAGSIALVADGVHSLSDMATDVVVLLGVYLGSKRPDQCHPYGHGRIETLAATVIGTVLAVVGGFMIYSAASDIAAGKTVRVNYFVPLVATASVIVKELLYRITKRVAVKSHSTALYANAWHHRSDALSSVAVAVGFIALRFSFRYGDQIAAIAVGFMVTLVGARVLLDCLRELTEGAIDTETIEHIKHIVDSERKIRQWHQLRTRLVGREVFLDLHILVDPDLNISAAHQIAEDLEMVLQAEIARPVNIIVHIEPDIPALRRRE
jgi:cation diffusion facilitator family transporter